MASSEHLQSVADELLDEIAKVADNSRRWSQEESATIYETLADECATRAQAIRSDMENDDD